MYSMKAVAELTGITPDTLRAWERRHHAISPRRESNGRRIYNGADIARLQLLRNATELGHSISKIAGLSNLQLQCLVNENDEQSALQKTSALTRKLIRAIENYRVDVCDEILGTAAVGMVPLTLARDLLAPTLAEVGALWHEGKINVAQEHLLSSSIKRMIFALIQVYQSQASGPALVFGALNPERHELGLLMTCLIAAAQGCRCYYLGPDIPREDLLHAVTNLVPRALVLSLILNPPDPSFIEDLTRLREGMPNNTELWIGGEGIASLGSDRLPNGCRILSGFEEFTQEISYMRLRPVRQTTNLDGEAN